MNDRAIAAPDAGALFRAGDLSGAILAANGAVRRKPGDAGTRQLLAELLAFDGQFPRADAVLESASAAELDFGLAVAEFRQLIRAAIMRQQVIEEGRAPEFLSPAPASQQALLRARLSLREGDLDAAASACAEAEQARPCARGQAVCGTSVHGFDDFRDACDLWGGTVEVLTTTGRYFWVPVEHIVSMQFCNAVRPRDLLWRRCTMDVRGGPDGDVYIPAIYATSGEKDQALRLGRQTGWTGTHMVSGSGQRVFLAGEEGLPTQAIHDVTFE